jgi:arginase
MHRRIAVIGAPSNIGIRPYEEGGAPRHIDRAPAVFRELGLVQRIEGEDLGDVLPPPYLDVTRPPSRPRNEQGVASYSRLLADYVARGTAHGRFALVLGGDCSIVLGSLLGAARYSGRIGLAYLDAHADFATPQESQTGSVASMCLAFAVGHGDSDLARLGGSAPLVQPSDTVLIGRRDASEPAYGHDALARSEILDLPDTGFWTDHVAAVAAAAKARLGRDDLNGFWIHVDADLLNPRVMPAVDSPEPGGPVFDELADLLSPLVQHPRALGLQVTLYDPSLDPDGSAAAGLVALFERVLTRTPPEVHHGTP